MPVPKPLPTVPIPLESPDPAAKLGLQNAFTFAYEWGAYDASLDYRQPPAPPLSVEHAAWAEALAAAALSSMRGEDESRR